MQQVLIVDDSDDIRKLLLNTFELYSHKFKTLTAKNGKEAADIVAAQKVDLVVTDIQMPVMDGLELIEFIDAHQPGTPIFIIAGKLSQEVDEKVSSSESLKFFAKPFSPKMLAEEAFKELVKNAGGEMHGVSIPSFLQLMEMDRRTCMLMIREGKKSGRISLRKGSLVNAVCGDLSGESAACEIISWDNATVQIKGGNNSEESVIKTPLMALIIEAIRLKDERVDSEKKEQSEATRPEPSINAGEMRDEEVIERQKAELPMGLLEILNNMNDVDAYRIFNEEDFVLGKSENMDSALKVIPSDYFELAYTLMKPLASGDIRYFQIDTRMGSRYIFLKYNDTRLLFSVKKEFRPENLINVLNAIECGVRTE